MTSINKTLTCNKENAKSFYITVNAVKNAKATKSWSESLMKYTPWSKKCLHHFMNNSVKHEPTNNFDTQNLEEISHCSLHP